MDILIGSPSAVGELLISDNNHWRFGWGDGLYNYHQQNLPLWAAYGPCRYTPKGFDVEIAVAIRKIADVAKRPLFVPMSGGLDSELVARIMVQERVPFTPLIARYENDFNKEDIAYAFDFCRKNNLTPEVVDVDIRSVIHNSIHTPYVVANCAFILIMHLMRYCARLGGMAVIAGGEQRYRQNKKGKIVVSTPIARIAVTHFMQAEGVPGVPTFFCYTPEIMLCLLREAKAHGFEEMSKLAHNIKQDIYYKYWPDMTHRPKYSGLERVQEERAIAQKALKERYGSMITQFSINVDKLERQLSGGIY